MNLFESVNMVYILALPLLLPATMGLYRAGQLMKFHPILGRSASGALLALFALKGGLIVVGVVALQWQGLLLGGGLVVASLLLLYFTMRLRDCVRGAGMRLDRFNAVLSAIPDMLLILDEKGKFRDYLDSRGPPPMMEKELFMNRSVAAVMPRNIAARSVKLVRRALRTNREQTFEYSLMDRGVERTFEARISKCSEGEALVLVRDVTETAAIGLELRRFSRMLEAVPDMICYVDREYRYRSVNEAYVKFFQMSREEILGTTVPELIGRESFASVVKSRLDKCFDGEMINYDTLFTFKDGRKQDSHTSMIPYRDASGNVTGAVIVLRDNTLWKRAEDLRHDLICKLEAKNLELLNFTYTASHDLRSPLITIRGFTRLLRKKIEAAKLDEAMNHAEKVENAALKMEHLLNGLLEYSRIEPGRMNFETVELDGVINDACELLEMQIKSSNAVIVRDEKLPPLTGDLEMMRKVFLNLLDNAIKYRGDDSPRVKIGVRREEDGSVIYVQDNGSGIPPEHRAEVFGLFNQLDPEQPGEGVGLALVKRIIERHLGSIWVESAPTGGTAVCFQIGSQENVEPAR